MLALEDLPVSFDLKVGVGLRMLGTDDVTEVVDDWVMGGG